MPQYIYSYKYDYHHQDLCGLESRQIFGEEEQGKVLFSDLLVDPSISPFILARFEVQFSAADFPSLLQQIKEANIQQEGFTVEYLSLEGDKTERPERREKQKAIGFAIDAYPDFENPTVRFGVANYNGVWYFGALDWHDGEWRKHKQKPRSFSNSICMSIAKSLVSIASKANKEAKLLDACCGVGTIMLEAKASGVEIEGSDIKSKTCTYARENLAHFNYKAVVHHTDVKDLKANYDAVIVDLPYNLYSYSDDEITEGILRATTMLSDHVVVVSISDIKPVLKKVGLSVVDYCEVEKRGKGTFSRSVWVCEKQTS